MKTIYIPWFWNQKDKIFENYLNWEWHIIQKNLRCISEKKVATFLKWKNKKEVFSIIQKHYSDLNKGILEKIIDNWINFQWFTRKITTTTSLTASKIFKIIDWKEDFKIVWHSQWWLIVINTILHNP